MKALRVLFLGASKRVSLLERFELASKRLGADLQLFSCESDSNFCPASTLATILPGPSFLAPEFESWLDEAVDRFQIDIVIPNMDAATVALSRFAEHHDSKCWPVVSARALCEKMYDKRAAAEFFEQYDIPVPPDTSGRFPKIAKSRFGFGGKGIHVAETPSRLAELIGAKKEDYVIQDFLTDIAETTVDIYHSPTSGMLGYVLRDRLEVSDGEVMVCRTREADSNERKLIEHVAGISGWQGCITLQYLKDCNGNLFVVEINPRFGGGATCSIEAGLDMPYYILSERLGSTPERPAKLRNLIMSRARRDFFCEY